MNFENNEKDEQIMRFMSEAARQNAQLQRGYDRMTFIAGAIVGLVICAQEPIWIGGRILVPLFVGGVFVFVRKKL
jgi:small basic protein